jgi:GNAT superfamily N-acetyltransferase
LSVRDALHSRVEDATLNASAPPEQRWLDGWLLRLSPGKAKRARCIHALAEGRLPLADRLALAHRAYREAGLPLILRCTPYMQPAGLEAALIAQGWRRFEATCVMVLCDFQAPAGTGPVPAQAVPAEEYADAVGMLRGSPAAHRVAHARRLAASPVPYRGFVWREGGEIVACGQIAQEAELVGLYDVFTAPSARRQGRADALCRWLLQRAADAGARHAYLQVERGNAPARALYGRLGFADAYEYHYLTPQTGDL